MSSTELGPTEPRRRLAAVLRDQLEHAGSSARLIVGEVVSTPDSAHVAVAVAGVTVTVPRLASYSAPVAGEPCYLLAQGATVLALGAVR